MEDQTAPSEVGDATLATSDVGGRSFAETVNRMHVRDIVRVIAGQLSATDLQFIPDAGAQGSIVRWTEAAVSPFRRR